MAIPPLPPFRIRESDGSPNIIPVLDLIVSPGTLTDNGGGVATLQTGTGAAAGVGASTAETYIVIANTDSLSSERALTGGLGIFIADSGVGAAVYVQVNTPFLVTSNLTLTAVYPILSGGALSANRSFHVDTAFLVNTSRTISTTAPVVGGGNFSADRTFTVDTAFLVGSTRAINTTEPIRGGGNLSADRTISIVAAGVNSAGALSSADWVTFNNKVATSVTISTTYPIAGGGDFSASRTHSVDTAFLISSNRTITAGTGLYGGGNLGANVTLNSSARLIRMPLALMTVQPDSANAFWSASTLPLLDAAYVGFLDLGEGIATYWGIVPQNLHSSPLWTLFAYHMPDAGAGGNAMVSFRASAVTQAETVAYTLVSSAAILATQVNTALAITQVSGANFDSVVAVSAGDLLFVEVNRHGANASDTVGQQWDLYALTLQCNVL